MTNTDTADAAATAEQVAALARAGSQLVRVTVNNDEAAAAVPEIARRVADARRHRSRSSATSTTTGTCCSRSIPTAPRALAKYRINPGNVGGKRRDENFRTIVADRGRQRQAGSHRRELGLARPGSAHADDGRERARCATPRDAKDVYIEAMLASALRSAELAEEVGLRHDQIIISAKVSGVQDLVDVYRRLAARCDYPLHLGLTEAGMGTKGIVASTAGLSILLAEGIGDTIRVSLTPKPNGDRTEEVLRRPADPAVARASQLRAAGHGVSRLRPHDVDVLPAHGGRHPDATFASRCRSGARRHPGRRGAARSP